MPDETNVVRFIRPPAQPSGEDQCAYCGDPLTALHQREEGVCAECHGMVETGRE